MADLYMEGLNKAQRMRDQWQRHDIKIHFEKGLPDYPTGNKLYKAIRQELEKQLDQIALNIMEGKNSKVNGNHILESVLAQYIQGTDYTTEELKNIMKESTNL